MQRKLTMQSARLHTAKGEQYRKEDNGARVALALHQAIRIRICSEETRLTQRRSRRSAAEDRQPLPHPVFECMANVRAHFRTSSEETCRGLRRAGLWLSLLLLLLASLHYNMIDS